MTDSQYQTFKGVITSAKANKTITVEVETIKKHKKYGKSYKTKKKYLVHDEKNAHKVGETVSFRACRPLSKRKRWMVI